MTSKERVRNAIERKPVDKIPAALQCVEKISKGLMEKYGFDNMEQVYEKLDIDIRYAYARIKIPQETYLNEEGNLVTKNYFGFEATRHVIKGESYNTTTYFPLNDAETLEDVEAHNWPTTDLFDYSSITEFCEQHPDKAIVIGHEGPFQTVTNLISMDNFFILMIEEPEVAQSILDHMLEFELAHYEQMFIAGKGQIDILRTHDDYGTQISTLFSADMWEEFFAENTKKLVALAHKYGAFFQQHSCGAVAPFIPKFIACGVDSLEPIQPVEGLDPETLHAKYADQLCFHGGIDTQDILPHKTPDVVTAETERYLNTLGEKTGYILMASQTFESDVPLENLEAVYAVDRTRA
ncbi:MAG: uroporphyrinogen decarboxylase family protein [Lachnospiraceae bacterium]